MAVMRGALFLGVLLAGCTSQSVFGPPTQSECPPESLLTYENFGKPFMEEYCTKCHSSELRGAARMGAPTFHDFDTVFGIRAVADHVDETTGSGPAATNLGMPPEGPYPVLTERRQLSEWIACGAPSVEDTAEH